MAEARQFGIDRVVLSRLVSDATLDDEAARRGLSVGDEAVQEMVLATPAFRGAGGDFDREAYAFALERAGLTPARVRGAAARRGGARTDRGHRCSRRWRCRRSRATTLLGYAGETRRFDWLALDAGLLPEPTPAPDEATVAAFYAANHDRYTRPETRRITYALLEPETLAATIEIARGRAARRLRRGRATASTSRSGGSPTGSASGRADEAAAALARIEAGEIDFDALAAERGLTAATIDQGELDAAPICRPRRPRRCSAPPGPGWSGRSRRRSGRRSTGSTRSSPRG